MFNKKKTEMDLLYSEIIRLNKQNKKLMEENKQLRGVLGEVEKYREEYKSLSNDMKRIKEQYQEKIQKFDKIQSLFVDEYNTIKGRI